MLRIALQAGVNFTASAKIKKPQRAIEAVIAAVFIDY